MLFSNTDFNIAYVPNFNFAYLEIEESFGLIWSISLASFHFGYLKGACFKYRLCFCSFCLQRKFWQIWVKITE